MPFSVEAAVISKKGAQRPFNTDAINAAGKVWPADVIHSEKGLRVVGAGANKPYYVLASSETKGTAQSAADLFQTCAEKFSDDGSNYSVLIADYLKAFSKVLDESGFNSADCAFSILAGVNDTVYAAKSADSRLFTYYDDTFTEICPKMSPFADNGSDYGIAQCNHVKPGDIFIMLTGIVASVFPAGLMKAICEKSEGDVRKVVSLIGSQAAKYGCEDAVSAIAVKVTDVELAAAAPVPEEADEAAAISAAIAAAVAEKNAAKPDTNVEVSSEDTQPRVKSGKRVGIILLICLLAVAVLAGLFFLVKSISEGKLFPRNEPTESTTEVSDTSSETETTTEEPTTVKDEPSSSEEPATEESTTEKEETTTKRRSSQTTTEKPTEKPTEKTTEKTTEKPTEPTQEPSSSAEPTSEEPSGDINTEPSTEAPSSEITEPTSASEVPPPSSERPPVPSSERPPEPTGDTPTSTETPAD